MTDPAVEVKTAVPVHPSADSALVSASLVMTPPEPVPQRVSQPPAGSTGEEDVNVHSYIRPSLVEYPVYDYDRGITMSLSKFDRIIIDAYLETNSEAEAARVFNAIRAKHGSDKTITTSRVGQILKKPWIAKYIADKWVDKGKVNWMDKSKWEAWGVDVMQGVKTTVTNTQVKVWEAFGKARGWYAEQQGGGMQFNQTIQIRQADGSV